MTRNKGAGQTLTAGRKSRGVGKFERRGRKKKEGRGGTNGRRRRKQITTESGNTEGYINSKKGSKKGGIDETGKRK